MVNAPVFSPREGQPPAIAIVGGGFSGAAAAIALLARVTSPFLLKIIDTGKALGAGVAYGDARRGDLLNVRAEDMRLRADIPHDFLGWLAGEDLLDAESLHASFYAPRRTFGAYVGTRLAASMAARPDVDVQHLRQAATEISRGDRARYAVSLQNGGVIDADYVIVATGYGLPKAPRFGYGAYEEIAEPVLRRARTAAIVGSGLSAIDAALFLAQAAPHLKIRLISRRGLRPLAQKIGPALSAAWAAPLPLTARDALVAVRRRVLDAAAEGKDWRAVLNGLRPVTQTIWTGFSDREKRRFARHLKPYWDVIRHRMPSRTALKVAELEQKGRIKFEFGTVRAGADGEIAMRPRGAKEFRPLDDDIIIDCAGHRPDLEAPAIQSLFAVGLACADALGLGVAVERSGRVVNRLRDPSHGLYALGPLGAGSLLEITASPEIAQQAWLAAGEITGEIDGAAEAAAARDPYSFRREGGLMRGSRMLGSR